MLRIQRLAGVFRGRVPGSVPVRIPARVPARIPARVPARHAVRSFLATTPPVDHRVEKIFKTHRGFAREEYKVDSSGNRVGTSLEWDDNGDLCEEGSYRNGERHGLWTWYQDKQKAQGVYVDDRKDGKWTMWDERGNIISQIHYSEDRLHGLFTNWSPSGEKTLECSYVKGRREGVWTEWTCGKKSRVLEYKDDVITKVVTLLDDQGRETVLPDGEIEVWKAGKGFGNNDVYIKIRVPAEARRVSSLYRKARIEYGTVVSIVDREGRKYKEADNFVYDRVSLRYVVGEVVKANGFDADPDQYCGRGIHVHLHREQCDRWFS